MKNPALTIIVASYNTGKFLRATLDSIKSQKFTDYECILVDGGSTDGTVEILKNYTWVKWISEKDSGYLEAFRKGLGMAKGKYIAQCAISDGYLNDKWLGKCIEILEKDPEVSLVWGLPQYMAENGRLLAISYPQFHNQLAPQKEKFFYYWLASFFWFPEGNFCVRKNVMEKCFPEFVPGESVKLEPWLDFNFNFQAAGYLPFFIPVIANYGRIHGGQLGEREALSGIANQKSRVYFEKAAKLKRQLLRHNGKHYFRDGSENVLGYEFSKREFWKNEILSRRGITANFPVFLKSVARRGIYFLEEKNMLPRFVRKLILKRRQIKLSFKK